MGKAVFGASVDPRSLQLMDEVRSLRQRVAELEAALAAAREHATDEDLLDLDEREPANS